MSNDSLLGLQWAAPAQSEILVKVVLVHGEFDMFTEKTLRFPESESGLAQMAIEALQRLSPVLSDVSRMSVIEDACAGIANQLNVSPEALYDVVEPVFERDLIYDYYAPMLAIRVEHRTPEGTRSALFDGHPYKFVGYIPSQVFQRRWDTFLESWGAR
jgi:hypothetical protein